MRDPVTQLIKSHNSRSVIINTKVLRLLLDNKLPDDYRSEVDQFLTDAENLRTLREALVGKAVEYWDTNVTWVHDKIADLSPNDQFMWTRIVMQELLMLPSLANSSGAIDCFNAICERRGLNADMTSFLRNGLLAAGVSILG